MAVTCFIHHWTLRRNGFRAPHHLLIPSKWNRRDGLTKRQIRGVSRRVSMRGTAAFMYGELGQTHRPNPKQLDCGSPQLCNKVLTPRDWATHFKCSIGLSSPESSYINKDAPSNLCRCCGREPERLLHVAYCKVIRKVWVRIQQGRR
jgi:hypothetical protein